jgi:hypothetical protein
MAGSQHPQNNPLKSVAQVRCEAHTRLRGPVKKGAEIGYLQRATNAHGCWITTLFSNRTRRIPSQEIRKTLVFLRGGAHTALWCFAGTLPQGPKIDRTGPPIVTLPVIRCRGSGAWARTQVRNRRVVWICYPNRRLNGRVEPIAPQFSSFALIRACRLRFAASKRREMPENSILHACNYRKPQPPIADR